MYAEYLRLGATLAHMITAIFLLVVAYTTSCPHLVSVSFYTTYYSSNSPDLFSVTTPMNDCPLPQTNHTAMGFPTTYWGDVWCQAMAVPQVWDVQQDPQTFTPGAGWNVLMLVVMFEWIACSWAVMYTSEPASMWESLKTWTPPGMAAQPLFASVWNLCLVVILWFSRSKLQVPDNNLFIFTAILIVTVVKQNYVASPMPEDAKSPHNSPRGVWKTDQFLKPPSAARGAKQQFIHNPNFLEETENSVVARLLQYATIAPMILMVALNCVTRTQSTWAYQVVLMAMASCLAISPVLHYTAKEGHTTAGELTILACALTFLSAFTVVVWAAWDYLFHPSAGLPIWTLAQTWFVIIMYGLYGLFTTIHYIPTIVWKEPLEESVVPLALVYDHMCIIVTMAVSWTLYTQWLSGCSGQC